MPIRIAPLDEWLSPWQRIERRGFAALCETSAGVLCGHESEDPHLVRIHLIIVGETEKR
jgi:hypothetical protein